MLRKVVGEAHLLNEDTSASIEQILIPRRFDIRFDVDGLRIVRLSHSAQQQAVQLTPYKSRGEVYRRVLASQVDGRQYVVEFVSNTEVYEPPILGAIRARDYTINGNVLELKVPIR
jgi:hypothetical protein